MNRYAHLLGSKERRRGGNPEDTIYEIRKDRDDSLPYDPLGPRVWGRLYYCRGTPVLFTPYKGWRDAAKDAHLVVAFVVASECRRVFYRAQMLFAKLSAARNDESR